MDRGDEPPTTSHEIDEIEAARETILGLLDLLSGSDQWSGSAMLDRHGRWRAVENVIDSL